MKTTKHVIVMLLCIALCMPLTYAQPAPDKRQEAQTTNTIAQDVLIIIQQEQVRFTAQRAVEEMRLQIFDQAGQLIYDSGAVTGPELTWVLRQADGEAVKSGLYAYTFSVKEAGAADARQRRGHFIVDRAKERDGKTDRLWITSQNDSGVGTELTVARNDGATIAGTSERKIVRTAEGDTRDDESELKSDANAALAAATSGTTGRIAKFVSATDLGDSVITEFSGKIGIGTTNPGTKLAVATPTSSYGISHTDGVATLSTFVGAGTSGVTNGGWIGTVSNHDLRFFTANGPARLTITPAGNIGIGTANPQGKLDVSGNIVLNGNPKTQLSTIGEVTFLKGDVVVVKGRGVEINAGDNGSGILGIGGNPNDNAVFLFGYNADKTSSASAMWFAGKDGGKLPLIQMSANTTYIDSNVGIGTITPSAKLDVVGQTRTQTLQITGGADFAENFDVNVETTGSEAMTKVEAGFVVSIDPSNPGKLQLSTRSYDRRVAGIISGAGGVKPGMMMSQEGTLADGQHPVALSGRVYCWVDASEGAIEVGDLLTTSSTPGYAMKAKDLAKAQGAIIGKAMTGLKSGKGLVLVLITLQ